MKMDIVVPFDAGTNTTATSYGTLTKKTYNDHQQEQQEQLGQLLQAFTVQEEVLRDEIQRVNSIKQSVSSSSQQQQQATENLCNLFQNEISRVSSFVDTQFHSLESSAKEFLYTIETLTEQEEQVVVDPAPPAPAHEVETLSQRADDYSTAGLKLVRFATETWNVLVDIAASAEEQLGSTDVTVQLKSNHETTHAALPNVAARGSSALIVVLSDIYEAIRCSATSAESSSNDHHAHRGGEIQWVAPSHFERSTNKFWVHSDNITEVVLQAVTEVPLLVYGRTGRLTGNKCNSPTTTTTTDSDGDYHSTTTTLLWGSLATPVSSVYFDNPDNMVMYRERLRRREGAQLFRIRWYGTTRPVGREPLFLELKTHHEKWVGAKSTKERVTIQAKDVHSFLCRDSDSNPSTADDCSRCWSQDTAERIVRSASPKMDDSKVEKAVALLEQMRRLVQRFKLRPLVRSVYTRAAFQSASSNALRITVDRDITLIDETDHCGCDHYNNNNDWCLPDSAILSGPERDNSNNNNHNHNNNNNSDVRRVTVPYAVLEVKTRDREEPDFVAQMLHEGTILDGAKFSKFLTGAAALNTVAVDALPYWAEYPDFVSLFAATTSQSNSAATATNKQHYHHHHEHHHPPPSHTRSGHNDDDDCGNHRQVFSSTATNKQVLRHRNSSSLRTSATVRAPWDSIEMTSFEMRSSNVNNKLRGVGRGGLGNNNNNNNNKSMIGHWFGGGRYNSNNGGSAAATTNKMIAPKKAVRVEPKSYFANERTFIQWISASLLLVTVSILLSSFSKETPNSSAAHWVSIVGNVLNLAAAAVVLYATAVYYRRIKLLQNGSPYGYVDLFGPIFLGAFILVGIVVLLVYSIQTDNKTQWSSTSTSSSSSSSSNQQHDGLYEEPGRCTQHKLTGMNRLTDQASDILLDPSRKVWLVPSLSEIRAIPAVTSSSQDDVVDKAAAAAAAATVPSVVVSIPDADIEGLTYGGDGKIYAVSEVGKKGKTELFALEWNGSNQLQVDKRWDVPTMNAEGIAYIPETDTSTAKLIIGGDNPGSKVTGEMTIYDRTVLDETTTYGGNTALSGRPFNGKILAEGLSEAKIAALQYFEGLLYVLHDNARVVRVWDLDTGIMHSQWSLPMVSHGYDKMWEGMYLERINTTRRQLLRGSEEQQTSSLILHLALDTPAEVWSFSVKEGNSPGSIILPSCAAAGTTA